MGPLENLRGQRVAFDTPPLIYFIEENPKYIDLVSPLFEMADREELTLITSVITLSEALVIPLRDRRPDLVQDFEEILTDSPTITTHTISTAIAHRAAELRAQYGFKTPDALQCATALEAGADAFVTNDSKLAAIKELRVVVLDQLLGTQ